MYADFGSIIREALACAARAEDGDVLTWPCESWSARPAGRIRPQGTFRPHDHPVPELCIAVGGRGAMCLEDRWFAFEPPGFAMIDRQVMHTEGWRYKGQGYCMLWMGLSQSSLLGHASVYEPGRGRYCPGRVWIHSTTVGELWNVLAPGEGGTRERWRRLRSVVLRALSEMHHETLHESRRARTSPGSTPEPREAVIQWLREFLDQHYTEPIDLKTLSALTGYTPNYLNAVFRKSMGRPVRTYLTHRRLQHAWQLCRESDEPIHAIARRVGYDDPLYFTRAFRRFHGVTPTEARSIAHRQTS